MPLLPITALEEVPGTLRAFRASIDLGAKSQYTRPVSAVHTLLPHCSIARALPEHTVNVLSDVTTGFADLAEKALTDDGRHLLLQYLDEAEAEKAVEFWEGEYQVQ
jgi:hypothetical protein